MQRDVCNVACVYRELLVWMHAPKLVVYGCVGGSFVSAPMLFEGSICQFYFSSSKLLILICIIDERSVLRESELYNVMYFTIL